VSWGPNKGDVGRGPAQGEPYDEVEAVKAANPAVVRYTHESAQV
jgi:hypothetical protein